MQIHQLQIAHDSVQDRLMLRMSTQANEEFRVWLTRRFVKLMWPHLVEGLNLKAEPLVTPAPSPAAAASPSDAAGVAAQAPEPPSFDQAFREENPSFPLGSAPLMASEAAFDKLPDGNLRLTLREARERSVQLHLNGELLTAFCSMLRAASEKAEWNLPLAYEKAPDAVQMEEDKPAPIVRPDKPRLLH